MPTKIVLPDSWRVGWEDVTPSEAIENADWIGPRLHPFAAYDVGSVVPTGFDAYARILHPAFTREKEVRWAEVATWGGKVIHPEVQFHALVQSLPPHELGTEPFVYPPANGVLPESQVQVLADLLSRHTNTPSECWFCLWVGYGYFESKQAARRVIPNPQRSYFLFRGSTDEAAGWQDGPNIWWPDDRTWCVASEIDLPYTYVGGSKELIEEILERPGLEALPSEVSDGITYDSDKVNAPTR
jgi:hypothetical protein